MSDFDPERFFFVKIQDSVGPLDRGDKYEVPLGVALAEHNLGEINGGGSQLGGSGTETTSSIAFCGIDVDTADRDGAVSLLHDRLTSLGAPIGTEIHYTVDGTKLLDELGELGGRSGSRAHSFIPTSGVRVTASARRRLAKRHYGQLCGTARVRGQP